MAVDCTDVISVRTAVCNNATDIEEMITLGDDGTLTTNYNAKPIALIVKEKLITDLQALGITYVWAYVWADITARNAQAGMATEEQGYQTDTGIVYEFDGAIWQVVAVTSGEQSYNTVTSEVLKYDGAVWNLFYSLASTALTTATDTTNFNGILSGADTDVQKALETIDDISVSSISTNAVNGMVSGNVVLSNSTDIIASANPFSDGSLIRKYQLEIDSTDTTGTFDATNTGTVTYNNSGFRAGTKSATYNSDGDYTDLGTPLSNLSGTYTINFKFYREGAGGAQERVLSNTNGRIALRVDGNTYSLAVQIASGSTLTITGGTYTDATWVNIKIELEANVALRLYADNVLIGENLTYTTLNALFNDTNLRLSIAVNWFNGRVDQFEIYNRILTATESSQLVTQVITTASSYPEVTGTLNGTNGVSSGGGLNIFAESLANVSYTTALPDSGSLWRDNATTPIFGVSDGFSLNGKDLANPTFDYFNTDDKKWYDGSDVVIPDGRCFLCNFLATGGQAYVVEQIAYTGMFKDIVAEKVTLQTLYASNLPTVDPLLDNALWSNSGVITLSVGA